MVKWSNIPVALILLLSCSACEKLRFLWSQVNENPKVEVAHPQPVKPQVINYREVFREMCEVVMNEMTEDIPEFDKWAEALSEGASYEGIYNGLSHSSHYRDLEVKNPGSSAEALREFAEELTLLEVELPKPTVFDLASTQPPVVLQMSDLEEAAPGNTQEIVFPGKPSQVTTPVIPAPSADEYAKKFVNSSYFTLKRVLGEEALKVLQVEQLYDEKLAIWYSQWATRMIRERMIDFGSPSRNQADEKAFYQLTMSKGKNYISWEVLNRLHRIINHANQKKQ